MDKKNKIYIAIGILLVLLVSVFTLFYPSLFSNKSNRTDNVVVKEKNVIIQPKKEFNYTKKHNEKGYESIKEAQSYLDSSSKETQDSKNIEENIEEMISYLESLDNYTNAYPSYEAHLNDTPDADVKTLAMIIKSNYKVSKLETYDTSVKEIKQVIISLSREDVSTISYLFYYNTESEQFELINLYGNLDSFAAE
jgi:hypothetical protein